MSVCFDVHTEGNGFRLIARSTRTMGAPITLKVEDSTGTLAEVTMFTENQAYVDALITVINALVPQHLVQVGGNVFTLEGEVA